ncbi:MAG TPA: restriction endonuclease [Roseiflexaceae bacterium]|nr:restriction endonuclease [Roseiflexaceae bacterium]
MTKPEEQQSDSAPAGAAVSGGIGRAMREISTGMRELRWAPVLLYGIGAGLLMPVSMLQAGVLTFVAGIVPVGAGLLLARSVKGHYALHGFMAGAIGAIVSAALLAGLIFYTQFGAQAGASLGPGAGSLVEVWAATSGFIAFSLLAFCTFGASTAGRIEERNRGLREEVRARGGALERPGVIRGADDIRGLSLPQFGSYVNNLFKKKGFTFKDYRFIDKDKHLDIWMEYQGEPWHLRMTVADKVAPGTIESLLQDMKREDCRKGVVLTSTEFMPSAVKAAKGRPVVLIDGETLYEIAEQ